MIDLLRAILWIEIFTCAQNVPRKTTQNDLKKFENTLFVFHIYFLPLTPIHQNSDFDNRFIIPNEITSLTSEINSFLLLLLV